MQGVGSPICRIRGVPGLAMQTGEQKEWRVELLLNILEKYTGC